MVLNGLSKMPMKRCFVFGCENNENSGVLFHRFPRVGKSNVPRCKVWAQFCQPNSDWSEEKTLQKLYTSRKYICGSHFKADAYLEWNLTKLTSISLPTVNPSVDVLCSFSPSLLVTSSDNRNNTEIQPDEMEYKDIIEKTPIKESKDMDKIQKFISNQGNEMDKAVEVKVEPIIGTKRTAQSETLRKSHVKKVCTQILQEVDEERSERKPALWELTPVSVEDPIDIFFKSLAATAKTLSPQCWMEAKQKLFLVMADIKEKNIKEKYSSSRATPNPSPLSAALQTSSPALSHSEDSSFAGHTKEQKEPRYNYNSPS